jgi:Carbon-nitrogen hydrolase
MIVTVATCQFPVRADIGANLDRVRRQLTEAARRGARVAHFPEAALSGYAGTDFPGFAGFDWAGLDAATAAVREHARALGIWVVVGSAHRFSASAKPFNCLYVIDDAGRVRDRYDKRFCAGDRDEESGDLAHYSPGDHFSVWDIDSVRCGAQICHDYRYPELYREYRKLGAELMFHSFHAGGIPAGRVAEIGAGIGPELAPLNRAATFTYPAITMPAAMTAAAASSHVWISCPNSSAPQSLWPAFSVRADGITAGRLRRNVAGVLITVVDTAQDLYDSTGPWRDRALAGVLHSGTLPRENVKSQRVTAAALPEPHAPAKS